MEEIKRGGKRLGAGRKPVLSKKKQFSFYVEGVKVIKFGSEEKFKKAVIDFIDGFGVEPNYGNPISELNKLPNYSVFDIQPKEAIVAPISEKTVIMPPKPQSELISSVNDFEKRLRAIKSGSEGEAIMREVKVALMPYTQKQYLERVAKEVSSNFFND
jgi:hypothetical protein